MLLKEIKDWFKVNYKDISDFSQISINKIDNNLEKALCFYNSKRTIQYINKLGVSSYSVKPLTILLRFGKNQDEAEIKANSLYNFFNKKYFNINSKNVSFEPKYEAPASLGTDDKGIIEYSIEIDMYYERGEKK